MLFCAIILYLIWFKSSVLYSNLISTSEINLNRLIFFFGKKLKSIYKEMCPSVQF